MSRTASFDGEVVEKSRELVESAETVRDLRKGLSVLLPAVCGVPNRVAAEVLGAGVATVCRMQKEIRDQVAGREREKKGWGGRRRETMSREEEAAFLAPWEEQAASGGVLVVPPIHAALEERVGHPVAASTVYRMLARHGWRKVAPDTCHPKRDALAQDEFKKGALRKVWRKPSLATTSPCQ